MDDLELMEAAVARDVRAVVIKSHHFPTVNRAALVNRLRKERHPDSDFEMFGGITLNRFVGGINPQAVEAALKLGAKLVWPPRFPRKTAAQSREKRTARRFRSRGTVKSFRN